MADVKEAKPKSRNTDSQGDLREFLKDAERAGELETIEGADPELEMGALFDLSHEQPYPPVLLFRDIKGVDKKFRMLSNVRTAQFVVGALDMEAAKAYRKRRKEKR